MKEVIDALKRLGGGPVNHKQITKEYYTINGEIPVTDYTLQKSSMISRYLRILVKENLVRKEWINEHGYRGCGEYRYILNMDNN